MARIDTNALAAAGVAELDANTARAVEGGVDWFGVFKYANEQWDRAIQAFADGYVGVYDPR